jgi:hypothetical protein
MLPLVSATVWFPMWFGIAWPHSPDHPQGNEWFMAQYNQNNGECCTGSDVVVLDDGEWRTKGDHYEVLHNGTWFTIEPWMLTQTQDNPTGHALVWIWKGRAQCFTPGTFY